MSHSNEQRSTGSDLLSGKEDKSIHTKHSLRDHLGEGFESPTKHSRESYYPFKNQFYKASESAKYSKSLLLAQHVIFQIDQQVQHLTTEDGHVQHL